MKKTINSKIFKILSILLFSSFFATLGLHSAFADTNTINIYSNIYNASGVIDAEFTYEITPSSNNPAGTTGEPTSVVIKFDQVEPSSNLTTEIGEIDFSDTVYQNYGIYTYTVREVASSSSEYSVSDEAYEIYVAVTTAGRNVYQQAKNLDDDTKGNMNFNHEPIYSFFTVTETTHGDKVDKNQYFRFKLEIDSLCIGCEYTILGQDEYVTYNGEKIETAKVYKVNASGIPNYIYLKHGQKVTVGVTADGKSQIPVGTKITIIGDENLNSRKWTMSIDGRDTNLAEYVLSGEFNIDIVMKRNMLVPNTGIFMDVLPFVLLILLGLVGFVVFSKLKVKDAK